MKSGVPLQQMLTEVKRQSESKEDYLIAPNRLRMESYGKEMFLHLSDDSGTELIEPLTITGIIFRRNFAPSMVVLPRPCWMVLKHQIQTHILNLMCTHWSGVNGCYSL